MSGPSASAGFFSASQARFADYFELTKPRLVSLVLLSTAAGFFLASDGPLNLPLFAVTLLGTALVAAGSMALNQWMERVEDSRMTRTASRPLPTGRVGSAAAFRTGAGLAAAGLVILFFGAGGAAAFLAAVTLLSYVLLYTPLKKITALCTIVGAVPGALPPLIGWAAVKGVPPHQAWILFIIIFLWQMPHFLAIAWLCRKDYAAAKFRMLPVEDPDGSRVGRQIILYSAALLPVSLLPSFVGMTGRIYFFGAGVLGYAFVVLGLLSFRQMDAKARSLFRASIVYLSLLLLLMVIDKT